MKKKPKPEVVSSEELDEALKEVLVDDREFKIYKRIVEQIKAESDPEDLARESKRLHSGRKSRTLTKTPGPDAVLEASFQDSANRSRLTQIRVDLTNQEGVLAEALEAIRAHIVFKYEHLLPGLRTKGDRAAHLNQYLKRGVNLRNKTLTLISIIDLYIKDIDQMSFTLKHAIDVIEMIYNQKGRVA